MFYTSKIPFSWEKRVNRNIFGDQLRMEDALLNYFEINSQFFVLKYKPTSFIQWKVITTLAWSLNIAKGTTDPRVEFISQVPHKSWSNFNFGISIKH